MSQSFTKTYYDPSDDILAIIAALNHDKYKVEQIIKNGPATIVKWTDGTKTIVKRMEEDVDDPYMAFCAALAKKMYGGTSTINKMIASKTVDQNKKAKKQDGKTDL